MATRGRIPPVLCALVVATACAELPQLERGTCGNFVLEAGEDCDTPNAAPYACRSCRYDCAETPCPTGYGCGADYVCRRPTGAFVATSQISIDARRLESADFDGDRRADLMVETVSAMRVHYFDRRGDPSRVSSVLAAAPHATCALGAKPLATLAVSLGTSLAVWRGQSDRTLATTLYPSLAVSPAVTQARVFVADALPPAAGPRYVADEYLLGLSYGTGAALTLGSFDPLSPPLLRFADPLDRLVGPVFARFGGAAQPCDTLVYSVRDAKVVAYFRLCNGAVPNVGSASFATLTTRGVGALVAGDVNADTLPDIVAQSMPGQPLEVAYGLAGPSFTALASTLASPVPDGTILAVGDVDGDYAPDWVDTSGVRLSGRPTPMALALSSAVLRDANGDGQKDIVAVGPAGAYFFFGTASPLLTPAFYPLDGAPRGLVVADFDGDRTDDVLVATDLGGATAKVWILWGRPRQFPEDAVLVGALEDRVVQDMAGGSLAPFLTPESTSAAAIAPILSRRVTTGTLEAPVLFGSPSRVLLSPLGVLVEGQSGNLRGRVLGVVPGRFSGSGHEGLALVAQDDDDVGHIHALRVWSAPSTGDAQLDPGTLVRSSQALPLLMPDWFVDPRRWDAPLGAAVDLDGDGVDELVLLAPPDATASGSAGALLVGDLGQTGFTMTSQDIGAAASDAAPAWQMRAADLDGDGRKDLVLLVTDAPDRWALRTLMNRGDGTLDLAAAQTVALPAGAAPVDVAFVRVDATSPRRALAFVTADGAWIVPWKADGSGWADARSVGPGGATLASGDFDGDGVEDLAVGDASAVTVLFQLAAGQK